VLGLESALGWAVGRLAALQDTGDFSVVLDFPSFYIRRAAGAYFGVAEERMLLKRGSFHVVRGCTFGGPIGRTPPDGMGALWPGLNSGGGESIRIQNQVHVTVAKNKFSGPVTIIKSGGDKGLPGLRGGGSPASLQKQAALRGHIRSQNTFLTAAKATKKSKSTADITFLKADPDC
jgi:hypothetical protein